MIKILIELIHGVALIIVTLLGIVFTLLFFVIGTAVLWLPFVLLYLGLKH